MSELTAKNSNWLRIFGAQARLSEVLNVSYLVLVLAALAAAPFLSLPWLRAPYLGVYVDASLLLVSPSEIFLPDATRMAESSGLRNARLLELDGRPVQNTAQVEATLNRFRVGDTIRLRAELPNGKVGNFNIPLVEFPERDRLTLFTIPYLIGFGFFATAVWVFFTRRKQSGGLEFILFASSGALFFGLLSDSMITQRMAPFWVLGQAMTAGTLMLWAFKFPIEDPLVKRYGWLKGFAYLAGLLIFAFSAPALFGESLIAGASQLRAVTYLVLGAVIIFVNVWFFLRHQRIELPIEREQIRLVLIGGLISWSPVLLGSLLAYMFPRNFDFSYFLLIPLLIFPVLCAYSIQRFRLAYTDYVLSRFTLYGVMALVIGLGYALMIGGLGLLFVGTLRPDSPIFTGLAFFVLALGFLPLRQQLQNALDVIFFRGQRIFQERLQTFSGELTNQLDLPAILQSLRGAVDQSLMPAVQHIFIYDPLVDQYKATPDERKQTTSDLTFTSKNSLVVYLSRQTSPVFLSEISRPGFGTQAELARLRLLGSQLYAPLAGRDRLTGWLALGPRLSGDPYTNRDLAFLDSLCDQAALAIERAQVIVRMETRVRETNVLARVAQGVNITLTLDDTLELVFAQMAQVISSDDFHILLVERDSGQLLEVFYVVDNERLSEHENRPVAGNNPLEQDVIRLRRPILTDNYSLECQKRGALSTRTNIFGWMCVPLNAASETIGAVSMGRHDPSAPYTNEQLQLLQAIADQVAGAIVKVRLLQETEKRARQLSILNEVTRQLTSTLELEPLLNNILKSAVEILNCDAGSLLLVENAAGDMVFRATAGPVAGDLLNKVLPAGTGLVGKAVVDRTPVIVNNVQKSMEWSQKTDNETGFITRGLMVIPLIAKDRVTGVIEVINKQDGSLFQDEDLQLLATFAAQASVAVENARQFTFTDQALTARVEELSVMQRIDRELNTSLDVGTTMKIALEWAMRQSAALAGLIGLVDENGLKIMASQGYQGELEAYQSAPLPLTDAQFQAVIASGLPQTAIIAPDNPEQFHILATAASRVILPIQREAKTIGLMLLESASSERISEEKLGFLQRLSDHASIAIYNAQLYAAIQSANVAKSEFVSFVAHELKNPMTSIKGYTELLAAGAVGSVNENQANFLATIRSNIERMNTLVSDLNDISKIEAGRLRLEFKAFSLNNVVEETIRSTRRQIEEKGQQLALEIPGDLPNVWADKIRLSQVMVNLVSNAHKYTPQGGQIMVGASAGPNQWDPKGAPVVVHIWVRDNGIGITPEDQKKIFQKFFRSEDPKTREVPGTGLGLNITRNLVEMQGGQIWFESEFRKGTTFHFTVPIAE